MRAGSERRLLGAALLALLAGCRPDTPPLTVLAASSLTEAFTDLERAYEAAHPGVDVVVSFGGSQVLAMQLRQGLRADAFASADEQAARALFGEGLLESPEAFASNRLAVVGVPSLEALASAERIVLGSAASPIGAYTDALLDAATPVFGAAWRAAVDAHVVSREPNVRLVLHKVARGEADAAVVYATDAPQGHAPAPDGLVGPTWAWQAAVPGGRGDGWVEFLRSEPGRRILQAHGFGLP